MTEARLLGDDGVARLLCVGGAPQSLGSEVAPLSIDIGAARPTTMAARLCASTTAEGLGS